MKHELPPLPYPVNALEPHMSKETLEFHHGKHHRTYVTKLNQLIAGTEFEPATLEDIVRRASGPIFNNAAQAWNHGFFWNCLSPQGGGEPAGEIGRLIESSFGSFNEFRKRFSDAAESHFGSGWAWLVCGADGGSLSVRSTSNADTPLKTGEAALLTCDVWEHAYYIDYRNSRADFLAAFWNLVNWDFVQKNYGQRRQQAAA
jgi:superoxide dismutase, Fe-Mn family